MTLLIKENLLENHKDPFLNLVGKLSYISVFLSAFFVHFVFIGIVATIEGVALPQDGLKLPLLYDLSWSITGGILLPITWVLFSYFHQVLPKTLQNLLISNITNLSVTDKKAYIDRLHKRFTDWKPSVIILLIVCIQLSCFFYQTFTDGKSTYNSLYLGYIPEIPNVTFYPNLISSILSNYLIFHFFYRIFLVWKSFRGLLQFDNTNKAYGLNIDVFHPDGFGGLKEIGSISFMLITPIIFIWISKIADYTSLIYFLDRDIFNINLILVFVFYFILGITGLIIPVFQFSKIIYSSKKDAYNENNKEYFSLNLQSTHTKIYDLDKYNQIKIIKERNNLVEEIPIVPYKIRSIKKVVTLLITSFIPLIVDFFDLFHFLGFS